MNSIFSNISRSRNLAWPAVLLAAILPATAAPVATTNEPPAVVRSVFNQPASSREGRDPFYPGSLRPYATAVVASSQTPVTTDLNSLAMQGTFGDPNHRLAIINNVTFAVGDEAEVITTQGRIRIHCIEITGDSAVVEAAGQRQVLHYKSTP